MATRPAASKKAPAKKAIAKQPAPAAAKSKSMAPAPKPKAAAAPVVTLKAVFEQLGEAHALQKKQAHTLLADFVTAVTTHLKQGARVRMSTRNPEALNAIYEFLRFQIKEHKTGDSLEVGQ